MWEGMLKTVQYQIPDTCQLDLFGLHTVKGTCLYHYCTIRYLFLSYLFGLDSALCQENNHTKNALISVLWFLFKW